MKDFDQEIVEIVSSMDIPKKDHDLMIGTIYENLKARIGYRIASLLSEEEAKELEEMDEEKFFLSLDKLIPNIDQMIEEELAQIRRELIAE